MRSGVGVISESIKSLTHVQLPYETGHIVVLVVERQQVPGELRLVLDDETATVLRIERILFGAPFQLGVRAKW